VTQSGLGVLDRVEQLAAHQAEALFASVLPTGVLPGRRELADAIRQAMRTYPGPRGCAAEVAAAFGDYPESAVRRMRWARDVIELAYPESG
jgi:hypothetical protein